MVRQRHALSRMRSQGVITEQQYAQAIAEQLVIRRPGAAEVHAEYAAEMVRQQIYAQYGELAYTTGLNVTTTLRAAEQQAAYKALRHTLIEHSLRQVWRGPESQENLAQEWTDSDPRVARALVEFEDDDDLRLAVVTRAAPKAVTAVLASGEVVQISGVGLRAAQGALAANAAAALRIQRGSVVRVVLQGKPWTLAQWPQAEGALVALDPQTGDVRALVGGFDFYRNQFNHVTQGWRQPGSSYKPFLYSGAIENGVQPDTLINDAPMENVGNWAPENDDGSTDGPITLRSALARSKNLVSIRLMQLLSPKGAREWTGRFGFDPERQPDDLTQALGSGATNPLQMAGAYAVLANGGYRLPPRLVTRITRASGEVVFEAPAVALDETHRVIPARNAFMVSSLLQEVTRTGTAARAQATLKRPDLYGKTGTTNEVVDAWFGGFQPGLVAVVWVGFDTPRSLGSRASGSALALPAWIEFMATALKDVPVQEVLPPDGLVQVDGEWRYAEWAEGGFVRSLGLDGDAITPALAVHPHADNPTGNSTLSMEARP
jgi:penicillin-binding protein 1A